MEPEHTQQSPDELYRTTQPPSSTYPSDAHGNNAQGDSEEQRDKDVIERMKIREICEGWPVYRDAAEWKNYRSMFHDNAYITTSWEQGSIDHFIQASIEGFEKGSSFMYILHRINGQTVEINPSHTRAVSKMKVTITCRFTFDGIEMDNEADCRFFFLLEKSGGRWGVSFFTLLFDKDRMSEVVPGRSFEIPEEEVKKYPGGYRYLCWCEAKLGKPPKTDLDAHGPERDILYQKCKDWLDGKEVKPNLTGWDVIEY